MKVRFQFAWLFGGVGNDPAELACAKRLEAQVKWRRRRPRWIGVRFGFTLARHFTRARHFTLAQLSSMAVHLALLLRVVVVVYS